ncbi:MULTISPECIES: hypothetical protein [Streptomyces]|uniref:hypothetical protein n=1 Tax=Streptomyces TaxID=1883 RepID=UPI0004BD7593|nr:MULTISPECIES: hypothetical protein [Streptomyces]MCX4959062.1 hypothetical protein [Streptomyces virginiae]MCX5177891.1 hypothetical protein [Streptomyces virginiae]PWK71893.1 hypothetical protein BCL76_103119 [Streptomyces sp. CG 926]
MSLDPQQRAEFVNAYTKTLITAWSSEEYVARLNSEPRAALAESGLNVPEGAEIVIVRTLPDGKQDGNLDVQVSFWEQGLATGRFEFHIPETPVVDTAELSEGDLSDVAAGGNYCCCPCSCCT